MQAKIFAILAAAAVAVAQSTFQINTPTTSIIQCVPIQLTWTGGSAPYTLTVNAFANGAVTSRIESIGNVQSSPYSYTVTAPVGTSLQFDLTDSRGAVAQSGGTPAVASGPSTSCLTSSSGAAGGASTSAAAGSSSSAAAGGASSSAAPSSSAAAGGSSSSSSRPSSSGTTSAPASATTSSRPNSAGSIRGVAGAVAGVVGIAAAALI